MNLRFLSLFGWIINRPKEDTTTTTTTKAPNIIFTTTPIGLEKDETTPPPS